MGETLRGFAQPYVSIVCALKRVSSLVQKEKRNLRPGMLARCMDTPWEVSNGCD